MKNKKLEGRSVLIFLNFRGKILLEMDFDVCELFKIICCWNIYD